MKANRIRKPSTLDAWLYSWCVLAGSLMHIATLALLPRYPMLGLWYLKKYGYSISRSSIEIHPDKDADSGIMEGEITYYRWGK